MYYQFMDKAFVFDMDGTLGETVPLAIEAVKAAYRRLNLPVPSDGDIVSHFGPTEKGLFQMMDEKNCGMLYAEYLKAYAALHGVYAPKPFSGIEDVLKKISSAGIRLGIVTGKSRDSAKRKAFARIRFRKIKNPVCTGFSAKSIQMGNQALPTLHFSLS